MKSALYYLKTQNGGFIQFKDREQFKDAVKKGAKQMGVYTDLNSRDFYLFEATFSIMRTIFW
jgi:hypothetical protein